MDNDMLIDYLTKDALQRCFQTWGVELTEEKIYELCSNQKMRECFLKNYKELLFGDKND